MSRVESESESYWEDSSPSRASFESESRCLLLKSLQVFILCWSFTENERCTTYVIDSDFQNYVKVSVTVLGTWKTIKEVFNYNFNEFNHRTRFNMASTPSSPLFLPVLHACSQDHTYTSSFQTVS